jgi:hypothetical protein
MIPSKVEIDIALQSNEWDFGNKILYELCEKCFVLKNQIEFKYNLELTNRQFDKLLILIANSNLKY